MKRDELRRVVAIVLSVAGIRGLAYGGFSCDRQSTGANFGPIELKLTKKKTVNVPIWAGIGTTAAGGLRFVLGGRRS